MCLVQSHRMPSRRALLISLGGYSAFITVLTLGTFRQRLPGSQADNGVLSLQSWISRDTWSTGWSVEFLANVAVFVVWGALATALLGRQRWGWAVFAGASFSLIIEIVQISTTRISDPRDLVANTLGALIGAGLVALATPKRGSAQETASG